MRCTLRRAAAGVALAAALATPDVAASQDGGVVVDPESPAGKEYALPLESARSEGAAGAPASPEGAAPTNEAAPSFGVGVSGGGGGGGGGVGDATNDGPEAATPGGSADVRGAGGNRARGRERAPAGTPEVTRELDRVPASDRAVVTAGDTAAPVVWSLAIAAALVLLGLAGAVTLRRSRSRVS